MFVLVLALINGLLSKGLYYKLESTCRMTTDQQIQVEGSVGLLCVVLRPDILTVPLFTQSYVELGLSLANCKDA